MVFGSVCSGIEAASVAFAPLGWRARFFAEIEPFPCAVLKRHYPWVSNVGDFTRIGSAYGPVDALVGGPPCQEYSIAGERGGMDTDRGILTLRFVEIAAKLRARWILFENVPGILSSNKGADFQRLLQKMAQCGYGFAYRIFDAQYSGIPQRRRRVFVVGYSGNVGGLVQAVSEAEFQRLSRVCIAVLFERQSLSWHSAPRKKAGGAVAASLTSGAAKRSNASGRRREDDENLVVPANPLGSHHGRNDNDNDTYVTHTHTHTLAKSLNSHGGRFDYETETFITHTLRGSCVDASEDGSGKGTPLVAVDYTNGLMGTVSGTIERAQARSNRGHGVLAFDATQVTSKHNRSNPKIGDPCHPLNTDARAPMIVEERIRRLTPVECERLQGFPDNYTLIPFKGKPAADSPRYCAIGNSWPVPIVRWIGARMQLVDEIVGRSA